MGNADVNSCANLLKTFLLLVHLQVCLLPHLDPQCGKVPLLFVGFLWWQMSLKEVEKYTHVYIISALFSRFYFSPMEGNLWKRPWLVKPVSGLIKWISEKE